MYVFVSVGELTGKIKQVALGQVDENATMREVLDRCMVRIESYLPERDRADARHFWHEDRLVPFNLRYLSDVASAVNLTLELRPDYYHVKLPSRQEERYAINPELTVAQIIDQLMQQKGAWRCYDLAALKAPPLSPGASLYDQRILPFHARFMQQENVLAIRRKPMVAVWSVGILMAAVLLGLLMGFLAAHVIR